MINSKNFLKAKVQTQQFQGGNKKLFFSYVQKMNNSGFCSNTRVLVLHSPNLSYLSKLPQLPFTNYSELLNLKTTVPLNEIEVQNNKGKKFQILFKDPNIKKWKFQMQSEKMAKTWVELIQTQKEKEAIKKQKQEQENEKIKKQKQAQVNEAIKKQKQAQVNEEIKKQKQAQVNESIKKQIKHEPLQKSKQQKSHIKFQKKQLKNQKIIIKNKMDNKQQQQQEQSIQKINQNYQQFEQQQQRLYPNNKNYNFASLKEVQNQKQNQEKFQKKQDQKQQEESNYNQSLKKLQQQKKNREQLLKQFEKEQEYNSKEEVQHFSENQKIIFKAKSQIQEQFMNENQLNQKKQNKFQENTSQYIQLIKQQNRKSESKKKKQQNESNQQQSKIINNFYNKQSEKHSLSKNIQQEQDYIFTKKQMMKEQQQSKKKEIIKSSEKSIIKSFKEQDKQIQKKFTENIDQNQQSSRYMIIEDYNQDKLKFNKDHQPFRQKNNEKRISRSDVIENQYKHKTNQKNSEKQNQMYYNKQKYLTIQTNSQYQKISETKKKSTNNQNIKQQKESIQKKKKTSYPLENKITSVNQNLFNQFVNISNKELQIDQKIVKIKQQKKRLNQKCTQRNLKQKIQLEKTRRNMEKKNIKDQIDLQYQFNYKWFKYIEQYINDTNDIIVNHLLFDTVHSFQQTSIELIKKIIDQLSLPESLQSYRPIRGTFIYQYQINNINISLTFSSLQKKKQGNHVVKIYQQNAIKMLNDEFRNFKYMATKGWDLYYRMPLAALFQYKGFIALSIARVVFSVQKKHLINIQQLQKEVNILSNIFEQSKYINLRWVNKIYYKEVKQKQCQVINQNIEVPINFELIVPSKIISLLPHVCSEPTIDILFRPQFIQNYPIPLSGKLLESNDLTIKEIKDLQMASNKLTDCKISQFIAQLQLFAIPIMTSRQLSEQFHKNGVNISYMGQILKEVNMPYLKKLLNIDLISRVCKKILRQNIQQMIFSNNQKFKTKNLISIQKELNQNNESLIYMVIDYFNLILGEGEETKAFQKIVQNQAWNDYKIQLDFNLFKPHFLLHLAGQCNIQINQMQIQSHSKQKILYINRENILGFQIRKKSYDLSNIQIIKSIRQTFNNNATEKQKLDNIISLVSPHQSQTLIPQYLKQFQGQVISFISSLVQPTHFLPYSQPINRYNYQIWLNQLKWEFYKGQMKFALVRFENIIRKLQFWYGQYNPFLQNIIKIACDFYLLKKDLQQALNSTKKQLINSLNSFGMTSFITAQVYNNCARILMNQNKKDQAINFYVKAMQIYEKKGKKNSTQYAQMSNQAALLVLSFGQIQQACQLAKFSMRILQQKGIDKLQDYMSSCSILSRIYQINHHFNEFKVLGSECMQMLRNSETMNSSIFEEGLKICIYPLLSSKSLEQKKMLVTITEFLQNFTKRFKGEQEICAYNQAFNYLRLRNLKKNLFYTVNDMMQNLTPIVDNLRQNNLLKQYEGYLGRNKEPTFSKREIDFLQLLECIIIMVNPLYLYGIFRQQ